MGGGGGKPPEPKKFVSPPIDNSPATNPIPNFFANRPPMSPYAVMAALQQVERPQPFQQFGMQSPPVPQFTASPPIQRLFPRTETKQAEKEAEPPVPSGPMTKEEYLARRKLGKGGGN
jgi:hypothetical protein